MGLDVVARPFSDLRAGTDAAGSGSAVGARSPLGGGIDEDGDRGGNVNALETSFCDALGSATERGGNRERDLGGGITSVSNAGWTLDDESKPGP